MITFSSVRPIFRSAALALLSAALSHAQGGSAIITLIMPPPGGEGFAMLQDGGPFANGAVAAYYNPALLADLARNTGSQIHYVESEQDLLPVLDLKGLDHDFQAGALVLPDREGGTDLGIGVFRNHVRFGENYSFDDQNNRFRMFDSEETVYGLALGIRLGIPVSLGGTVKFFDSRLMESRTSAGEDLEGRAQGWAFDAGLLANPRLRPRQGWTGPFVELTPSFSAVIQNMGPDAFYLDQVQADPIPLSWNYAVGLQLRAFDALHLEAAISSEKEIASRAGWTDFSRTPVLRRGWSGKLLFFRYSRGWLFDDTGKREELHTGYGFELEFLAASRFWKRLASGDFTSPSEAMDRGYPFAWTLVGGIPFRANPRVSWGWREIDSRDDGIRDGQKAFFMSFSM